ncbi:hypothetical protein [Vibrio sp. PNB22_8_1]|uniref:hypothetical protein n=1 Tax=unclassified Vibrio TaxID=2614977 RepID=UPI00406A3965
MRIKSTAFTMLLMMLSFIMGPIASAGESISFSLKADDIQGVMIEENVAWLKLSPPATNALAEITDDANQGKWLQLSVEDIQAMKVRIHTPIDSGVIKIDHPSSQLSHRLGEIKTLLTKE